jgi:hypothetical protein
VWLHGGGGARSRRLREQQPCQVGNQALRSCQHARLRQGVTLQAPSNDKASGHCRRGSRTGALERVVLDEDLGREAVFLVDFSNHRQRHSTLSTEDFAHAWTTAKRSREVSAGQTQLLESELQGCAWVWREVLNESELVRIDQRRSVDELMSKTRQRARRRAPSAITKCPTSLVAGARYAQRCPVDFGVPMEAVIAA